MWCRAAWGIESLVQIRTSPRQRVGHVESPVSSAHHGRARPPHGVHDPGQGEIPRRKPPRDIRHVDANRGHPRRVGYLALQHDAPAIGQGLEDVGGGVLIDSHHLRATLLHRRKRTVLPIARDRRIATGTRAGSPASDEATDREATQAGPYAYCGHSQPKVPAVMSP
jgi:hypothetical protein